MHYVYLLESESFPDSRYVGLTSDLRKRLSQHNSGQSSHTSKFMPWRLVSYVAFSDLHCAERFEEYLKSGSGHTFAKRRLWGAHRNPIERFQELVCHNQHMRIELRRIQGNLCSVCREPLDARNVVIHHLDYAHQCTWGETQFKKRRGMEMAIPDCEACHRDDATRFQACRRRLQLLHNKCHAAFHAGKRALRPIV
jgi:putative endonuclease